MIKGGYVQRIARVNLEWKRAKLEHVEDQFAVKYTGGRGWGARILYDEIKSKIGGFDPQNKIVVASGPLSGLLVPGSAKISFSAISPATGLYGDSNLGGEFSVALKKSGLDALIIEGKAEKETYLVIDGGSVEFRDAGSLWGMLSLDAEDALKRELGRDYQIAVIGPAGENLVKFAAITSRQGRQAARCGIGTLMGWKKLKAIAVRGDRSIPVADSSKLQRVYEEAVEHLVKHPSLKLWHREGTLQLVEWANEASCLPTRNFREAQFEYADRIGGKAMESTTRIHNKSCYLCPIGCGQINEVKGVRVEGPEYETAAMIGSNCALTRVEDLIYANYICDQLGLDTISAGNTAAFAIECFERGLINIEDTEGIELRFGNADALYTLFERIAYRKGIGEILAEGVRYASRKVGKGSERFAMHVKGLEISGYDVRAAQAMALAYATADIGAHHNRAWAITYDMKTDRCSYGDDKVQWVIYLQHVRPMFDALGVCRFPWVELGLELDFYAQFYSAATGIETTLQELLKRSEISWNLTRLINLRQGLTPKDDWLPDRVFDDPIPSGSLKGASLNRDAFGRMVKSYYRLRGWSDDGVPTKEKLLELGLEQAA
ncbi:MAG: aldehyde ferredoxin oxidoreductase family protein [Candidatus Bathyarchaeia archaeon]